MYHTQAGQDSVFYIFVEAVNQALLTTTEVSLHSSFTRKSRGYRSSAIFKGKLMSFQHFLLMTLTTCLISLMCAD